MYRHTTSVAMRQTTRSWVSYTRSYVQHIPGENSSAECRRVLSAVAALIFLVIHRSTE